MQAAAKLPLNQSKGFSYSDYLQWNDDQKWELIDGVVYNMTLAPSRKHQKISMELAWRLGRFFSNKNCDVYTAPFDVRFPEEGEPDSHIKNVVQPDISVICDKSKLDDRACKGAPDFIIEIVSPFTARKDLKEKLYLYESRGVKEYWLILPEDKILMQHTLANGNYGRAVIYSEEDKLSPSLFPALVIDLALVFQD
jgi:Uma2 family endonuclease